MAVLGYDFNTHDVLKTLVALGFQPILLYGPNGGTSAGQEITVFRREVEALRADTAAAMEGDSLRLEALGEEEFCRRVATDDIPVVIGSYGLRERDYFRENLLYLRNRMKFRGRVLHPAFLCDFHRNPTRRFAIIGFPGSGNMIVQSIAHQLYGSPATPIWAADPLSALITQFALSYWNSLANHIAWGFDDRGRWQYMAGASHVQFGAMYIAIGDEISPTVFAGLPQRAHVWSNPWHTSHEPLTARTAAFFSQQNFEILQVVRHPLDLVVSNAAKISAAAGNRAPQLLLQNDDWMNGMLSAVEAYFNGIAEHRATNGVSYIRYEELLASPVPTIRQLAGILNTACDDEAAGRIWTALSGKTLSGAAHRWDPRAGKWREFIPPRFAEQICNSQLREYAEAVGYPLRPEDFQGARAESLFNECDPLNLAWQDARWETSTGKQPAITHPNVYRRHDKEKGLLTISSQRYADVMDAVWKSPLLHDLLSAGSISAWPERSLIADYLGIR